MWVTWEEIVALYRLTLGPAPHNLQPRFNVCPTTPIDTIVSPDGERRFEHASVSSACVVVEASQGAESRNFQCARRDCGAKADISRCVQAQTLPEPSVGLLRVAGHAWRQKWSYYQSEHEVDHGTHRHSAKRYRGDHQIGPEVRGNDPMFHLKLSHKT
jgi:hypothetical protein